jgi:hypothetical protein
MVFTARTATGASGAVRSALAYDDGGARYSRPDQTTGGLSSHDLGAQRDRDLERFSAVLLIDGECAVQWNYRLATVLA